EAAPSLLGRPKQVAVGGAPTNVLAAQKLESGGKLELAFDAYVQLRRYADAARVAKRMGRSADAAQLYADAGLPLEAAESYLDAGDTGKALDNLVRVPLPPGGEDRPGRHGDRLPRARPGAGRGRGSQGLH